MRLLLVSVLLILAYNNSLCCTCGSTGPITDKDYNFYDLIFTGAVINVDSPEEGDLKIISLVLTKLYKGSAESDTIKIQTPKGGSACGVYAKKNDNFLMYAKVIEGYYYTRTCYRTRRTDEDSKEFILHGKFVKEDIKYLESKLQE